MAADVRMPFTSDSSMSLGRAVRDAGCAHCGRNGPGEPGADGALGVVPAAGGVPPDDGGAGGAGAAGTSQPVPGLEVNMNLNGGGGGGAAGYIVLHCEELEGGGLVSPAPFRTVGCEAR